MKQAVSWREHEVYSWFTRTWRLNWATSLGSVPRSVFLHLLVVRGLLLVTGNSLTTTRFSCRFAKDRSFLIREFGISETTKHIFFRKETFIWMTEMTKWTIRISSRSEWSKCNKIRISSQRIVQNDRYLLDELSLHTESAHPVMVF